MSKSIIRDKAKSFAIRIIHLYQYLRTERNEFVLSKQLLRSGTSIGANLTEQEFAISQADYLNKTSIALKEAAETDYWIDLLHETKYLTQVEYEAISKDVKELISMLVKAVKTIREKAIIVSTCLALLFTFHLLL